MLKNHDLTEPADTPGLRYERRPFQDDAGHDVPGLHAVWITLDNPSQFNSYTTEMVKGVILGMRRASNDRAAVAVVFTGAGTKAFCTGGNTKEYAEYYAGRPEEYRQYMRLFNDMVSAILMCDKPVVCRVNGMRIGGGQEIGMACDFSIAQDLAQFGQAGPAARLGARRREHGFSAALRRRRGRDGKLHGVRAVERAQGAPPRPAHRSRPGAESGRTIPVEPDGRDRSLGRRRAHRLWRFQAGRRARRRQSASSSAARSISRSSIAR